MSVQSSLTSYFSPVEAESECRQQKTLKAFFPVSTSTPYHCAPSQLLTLPCPIDRSSSKQTKRLVGRPRKRPRNDDDSDCVIVESREDNDRNTSEGDTEEEAITDTTISRRRYYRSYKQSQRQAVVAYAQKYGVQKAMDAYSVPRSTLRGLMAIDFAGPIAEKECGRAPGGGRRLTCSSSIEEDILEWVLR